MSGTGERTEKPTARRLKDARERGQVARSRDLAQAAALLAALGAFAWMGSSMMGQLTDAVTEGLTRVGQTPSTITPGQLMTVVIRGLYLMAIVVGPVAFMAAAASVGIQTAQGGWMFSTGALQLDWSRLSPAAGLKRLGISKAGVDTLKTVIGFVVLSYISYSLLSGTVRDAGAYARLSPLQAAIEGWGIALRLLWQCALALFVIAAVDYAVQRWRFTQSLRMTKQEVRDDSKMTEGNPEIKGRVRRMQREQARRRMMSDVRKATLVITNPTHYAVALEYRRESMIAPKVVAKGKNLIAGRIKDIAKEHDIPTVENVALARALYKGVDVGQTIPSALFDAVAEVLAYLIRLKRISL